MRRVTLLLFMVGLAAAVPAQALPEAPPFTPERLPDDLQHGGFWAVGPRDQVVERVLASMSSEERVAQLLMVGWPSREPSAEIMRWISERNIGGVKVFGWNGEHLPTLANTITTMQEESLRTRNGVPLFTATDQEGGWVRHVKGATSLTPGNMAIGATGLPYDAYQTAYLIGMELRALGINMNFAPTVDVYRNPEAHVIGPRAFSSDPLDSAVLGTAYYRGLEVTRVMATAKHFPGHGNAAGDSHGILPVIYDDWDTVWEQDLLPFRVLVREGVPAVLSGHLSFPTVSGTESPASISSYFKTTVLRERLGFEGVVITDDLYMGGALEYGQARGWSFAEICKRAIEAGNDIIMLSQTPEFNGAIWNTLYESYLNEPEFAQKVDDAVRRILRVKLRYLRDEDRVPLRPDADALAALIPQPAGRDFFLDQAARSVTLLGSQRIPLNPETTGRVLLLGADPDFFRVGLESLPGAATYRFQNTNFYQSSAVDRSTAASLAPNFDTIIFLLADPNSAQILRGLQQHADRIIVYSILTPVYLRDIPWIHSAIAVYGWGVESFRAGFAVLRGQIEAQGMLPVPALMPVHAQSAAAARAVSTGDTPQQ